MYDPHRRRALFSRDVIFDKTKVGIEGQKQESESEVSSPNDQRVEIASTDDSDDEIVPVEEMNTDDTNE